MSLGERKKTILRAVIIDYIDTAEPVGSRTIAKKYEMGISSATIRNEMADLEELGYLEQPHTSAGRIPSDKGYRFFVNELMELQRPSNYEIEAVRNFLDRTTIDEIDNIIKQISKILSNITQYTSAVLSPSVKKSSVKSIQLIQLSLTDIIAVVITDTGIVRHCKIKIPRPISSNTLIAINNMLNEKLAGLTVEDIDLSVISSIQLEMKGYDEILNSIIPVLNESLKSFDCDIFLDGTTNIFHYPEYNDIEKAKNFLSLLEHKEKLLDIFSEDDSNITVSIGKENIYDEVKECSIVKASYKIGDKTLGKIGVIGPTRMNYAKVIGILKYLTDTLNNMLKNQLDE
ncbi:MAG: heat-inducible transcriptional repressor HrcA [Caloramator sp.]|nr:heat-inducible transcriptional repressor HrcA [Caloramator sp.]